MRFTMATFDDGRRTRPIHQRDPQKIDALIEIYGACRHDVDAETWSEAKRKANEEHWRHREVCHLRPIIRANLRELEQANRREQEQA